MFVKLLDSPRRICLFIVLVCVALLSFGMYLQHVVGLEPCPMCIVQRYVMVLIGLVALLGAGLSGRIASLTVGSVLVLLAGGGAYVAARQTWLQWYPPEVVSCGRDFYGMIETFPLQRAIPMIFKGGGDCSKVDWTFLGGSIANWSFVAFVGLGLLALATVVRLMSQPVTTDTDAGEDVAA
ncbi:disulfide bond formation protein B [Limnohabitans sp.]|uniref:disulfide bond formation protein B n=1 Tax=Limnohabitans sp. TaxID=1907725 RepID=UPI00286F16E1|nr:disulfide bond formation protein B [Limnohabitans sp.]